MSHFNGSPSIETAFEKIKRHPKYYLFGGDVHFLVESYLFRVHRYFFERESAWFREKLAIPAPAGQPPKGSSDANPFPLDGVAHHDFSRFLWIFYNPKYSIYEAGADDWIAILRQAYDWRFPEVKRFAIRELEKFTIDALNKIDLYQRFEVDKKLLIPSYIALIVRPAPLSIQEARQIGLETAMLIATARECARGKIENGARSPGPVSTKEEETVTLIRDLFGITNVPATPSLDPIEEMVVANAVMSPSQPSKFDPSLTMSKPGISPYTTLGSASATITMLNSAPSVSGTSDVFGLTGTPGANSTSPNGANSAGQSQSHSSHPSTRNRLMPMFQPQESPRQQASAAEAPPASSQPQRQTLQPQPLQQPLSRSPVTPQGSRMVVPPVLNPSLPKVPELRPPTPKKQMGRAQGTHPPPPPPPASPPEGRMVEQKPEMKAKSQRWKRTASASDRSLKPAVASHIESQSDSARGSEPARAPLSETPKPDAAIAATTAQNAPTLAASSSLETSGAKGGVTASAQDIAAIVDEKDITRTGDASAPHAEAAQTSEQPPATDKKAEQNVSSDAQAGVNVGSESAGVTASGKDGAGFDKETTARAPPLVDTKVVSLATKDSVKTPTTPLSKSQRKKANKKNKNNAGTDTPKESEQAAAESTETGVEAAIETTETQEPTAKNEKDSEGTDGDSSSTSKLVADANAAASVPAPHAAASDMKEPKPEADASASTASAGEDADVAKTASAEKKESKADPDSASTSTDAVVVPDASVTADQKAEEDAAVSNDVVAVVDSQPPADTAKGEADAVSKDATSSESKDVADNKDITPPAPEEKEVEAPSRKKDKKKKTKKGSLPASSANTEPSTPTVEEAPKLGEQPPSIPEKSESISTPAKAAGNKDSAAKAENKKASDKSDAPSNAAKAGEKNTDGVPTTAEIDKKKSDTTLATADIEDKKADAPPAATDPDKQESITSDAPSGKPEDASTAQPAAEGVGSIPEGASLVPEDAQKQGSATRNTGLQQEGATTEQTACAPVEQNLESTEPPVDNQPQRAPAETTKPPTETPSALDPAKQEQDAEQQDDTEVALADMSGSLIDSASTEETPAPSAANGANGDEEQSAEPADGAKATNDGSSGEWQMMEDKHSEEAKAKDEIEQGEKKDEVREGDAEQEQAGEQSSEGQQEKGKAKEEVKPEVKKLEDKADDSDDDKPLAPPPGSQRKPKEAMPPAPPSKPQDARPPPPPQSAWGQPPSRPKNDLAAGASSGSHPSSPVKPDAPPTPTTSANRGGPWNRDQGRGGLAGQRANANERLQVSTSKALGGRGGRLSPNPPQSATQNSAASAKSIKSGWGGFWNSFVGEE